MEHEQTHGVWQSRMQCLAAPSQWSLAKQVNDFYASGNWIVATHTFAPRPGDANWTALIWFKTKS